MPYEIPFYANYDTGPQPGDVYTKGDKVYGVTKDLDLIGIRTGKVWGNANDEVGVWPSAPRFLLVSDGETT